MNRTARVALALALQFFRCFPISRVKVTEKMQRLLTEWRRGAAPLTALVLRQCPTAALTNPKSRNLQKMTYVDVNDEVMPSRAQITLCPLKRD